MYDATLQSNPKIEPRINFLFHFKFKDNVFDFPGRFTLAFHSVCWFQEEERSSVRYCRSKIFKITGEKLTENAELVNPDNHRLRQSA